MEIKLRLPFKGNYPVTFAFGAVSDNEEIRKKFSEWSIIGHNGIDYGIPQGSEVLAVADGKVIQSGDDGDFGISVTIAHEWGTSIYAHLKATKVSHNQEVKLGDIIALSGKSEAAYGEHLHFGIKPTNPDANNGYLGYINPAPYFTKSEVRKRRGAKRGKLKVKKSSNTDS